MDAQSGESKDEEVMGEQEQRSQKWRNWYQNEVDEKIKRVGSKEKVKHNKKRDQLSKPAKQVWY